MIRKANLDDKGKTCIRCGHVIYFTKKKGLRCMCDNPQVYSSVFDRHPQGKK